TDFRFFFDFLFFAGMTVWKLPEIQKKKRNRTDWIPACAGMTDFRFFFDFLFFAGMTVWVLSLWSCDAGNAV
ncbi:hypothetical protein, partial [Neisseria meningitidis]|uniref:hypothetical protein n=1 Tax=Neisseria meningitidis TaxID=487 RepID=UPI001E64A3DF